MGEIPYPGPLFYEEKKGVYMATKDLTDEQLKAALRQRVCEALGILGEILADINRLDGIETGK